VKEQENKLRTENIKLQEKINECKKAEKKLRESEERYKKLLEGTFDLVQSVKKDGKFMFVNDNWLSTLGYTKEDLQELSVFDVIHPRHLPSCREMFSRVFSGEILKNIETSFISSDGREIFLRGNAVPRYMDGEIIGTQGFFQDVTERRKAKERLQQETKRTKLLLELYLKAPDLRDKELYDYALDKAVSLTSSAIGFFHQVADDKKTIILTTWNSQALKNCTAAYDTHYSLEKAGNWVDCVRQNKPVIYNDFQNSPNQRGLPKGHTPLKRFMSIPVMEQDKIRYIFGVGNKEEDYEEHDVAQIQLIANELAKIMKQRNAEKALKASEEKYRKLFENVSEAIVVALDGVIKFPNPMASELSGYSKKELISKPFIELVHPEDQETVLKRHLQRIKGREVPASYPFRIIRKDGKTRWVEINVAKINWEEKSATLTLLTDVTKRREAENELKKHQEHLKELVAKKTAELADTREEFEQIFNLSVDMISIADLKKGFFTKINPAFNKTLGFSEDEILNKPILDFIHPEDRAKTSKVIEDQLSRGDLILNFENRYLCKDGTYKWLSWMSRPVPKQGITYSIARDITDLKKSEEELQEAKEAAEAANKAKSDFLASMSHELRTPLNSIIGFSEVLQEKYFGELNGKQAEYVADIRESGKHLLALINDILDLSKVEAGKMELELSKVNIKELLENSLDMFREKASKHEIGLNIRMAKDVKPLEIEADERKIKQIMFNLLSNAVKFTPDGGTITVEAKNKKEELTISVSDTGIGITPDHQEKIFEEFYQVRGGIKGKTAGTGLGLPLTRRLVEMHGGTIWVESEGKDKGSRFNFSLLVKSGSLEKEKRAQLEKE
jgi:PAS domain S-box-containing protein